MSLLCLWLIVFLFQSVNVKVHSSVQSSNDPIPLLLTFCPTTLSFTYSVQSLLASLLVLTLFRHNPTLGSFNGWWLYLDCSSLDSHIASSLTLKIFALMSTSSMKPTLIILFWNAICLSSHFQIPLTFFYFCFHSTYHHLTYYILQLLRLWLSI